MMECKTVGNKNPIGLQKVYVAKDDSSEAQMFLFELERMIFSHFDCAIYTDAQADDEELRDSILKMNVALFILTPDMLNKKNVNVDEILPRCIEKKIPVLPLLIEKEWKNLYSNVFGEMQYLCPKEHDNTRIPFEQKLIERLSSILLNDDQIKHINSSFRKSLFLSYRQKNREIANALMKKIHEDRDFMNVAIWYDERITTGESFSIEIENAMKSANGFMLLAEDAVLEMPNYVYEIEYKKALDLENLKDNLIAVRLAKDPITDEFYAYYNKIHKIYVGVENDTRNRLLKITGVAKVDDADTLYYLGVAYQNGIRVEINPVLSINLLTESASMENTLALERLVNSYVEGAGVEKNYDIAITWQRKLIEILPEDQHVKEYGKLGDIFAMKLDYDSAILNYRNAIKLIGDNPEQKDEITTKIIRMAMNKDNEDGFEIALDTCLDALSSIAKCLETEKKQSLRSLSMILFETINILFRLSDSKQFVNKVQAIASVIYKIRFILSTYSELYITECLHDSAFHDSYSKQAYQFFTDSGIASDDMAILNKDWMFEYNNNEELAEELSYIFLAIERKQIVDDLPSCYQRIVEILMKTIDFYAKRRINTYAKRNLALVEKILEDAEQKWYLDVWQSMVECKLFKIKLYLQEDIREALGEIDRLFSMIEERKDPIKLLRFVEVIDHLLNLVPTDVLADNLLIMQEEKLSQIPEGLYYDKEVDVWKLRNSVNRYISLLRNDDEQAREYYGKAIEMCKRIDDYKRKEVFIALQRLYLARLSYFRPSSFTTLPSFDELVNALLRNLNVYLEGRTDAEIDGIVRDTLFEIDQYLSWLDRNFSEHAHVTCQIVNALLHEFLIPYVNGIMAHEPIRFLPPSKRYEFTDFALAGGIDLSFLKNFRSLYFIVHSFVICNMDNCQAKISYINKIVEVYEEIINKTKQGYLFQMLQNENELWFRIKLGLVHSGSV